MHATLTNKNGYKIDSDPNYFYMKLLDTAKVHAKYRHSQGRTIAGQCTITRDYLLTLHRQQGGRCFYSGLPLCLRRYSDWKCSLERLVPDEGYHRGNVVLIACEFQSACQWNLVKMSVFMDALSTSFYDNHVIEIFDEQRGLCAYSGIPMTFGSYHRDDWMCSAERKDTSIGYTRENVCFICYELNTTVILRQGDDRTTGNSGWSREKVAYLKNNYVPQLQF